MKRLFGLLLMVLSISAVGLGQAVSVNGGSIQGAITDNTGAVVPNSAITIRGTDTGFSRSITTDASGYYTVGPLIPGNYLVTVSASGFQTLSVNTVIRTGTVTSGSFKLSVGQSNVTVEVNAGAVQVNTEQVGVSDVITKQQIDTLPVNGRNFLDLAQIAPGVVLQSGESFDPTKAGYSAISVSGVSGRTTRILLDGQDITDETVGTTIFNVSTGSIGDFQLNRSTQDVSGEVTSTGQVLVSTNSGTNTLHGQVFYLFQDNRAGFANSAGGQNVPFQRNQFGGSVGGPIIKDKLFFFGNSERVQQATSNAITLGGLFQAIQQQYPVLPSPYRQTYSTVRLDYNGPHGAHFFARANYNVDSSVSNFGAGYELYTNRDNTPGLAGGVDFATGRFTHSFRGSYEKFHNLIGDATAGNSSVYQGIPGLNFRYSNQNLFAGPNVDAPQGTFQSDKQIRYDGSWTRGTHNIRYGYSLNRILGGGFASFFGLAPRATISSSTLLANCGGVAGAAPCPNDPLNGYKVSGVRFGNGQGYFTENPGFNLPAGGVQDWRQGAYISDNWKVTPSFTFTAGVRWSVDTDRANQGLPTPLCSDVVAAIAPCSGSSPLFDLYQPGLGKKIHQPWANFAPQIGFTFAPGDHKTVIRAGFGIFYEGDVFNNTTNARGYLIKSGLFNVNDKTICGGTNQIVFPSGAIVTSDGGVAISDLCNQPLSQAGPHFANISKRYQADTTSTGPASNPEYVGNTLSVNGTYGAPYRTPYSEQWNFGVQREVVRGGVLTVDYVHNSTLKVAQQIDVNHVGAARFLNTAAAKNAIATTLAGCGAASINAALAPGGCPSGSGANGNASIGDFASNGLDSGNVVLNGTPAIYNGVTPATGAAFPGANPALGNGIFLLPVGRSGYDALQAVFRQQASHPAPGIMSSNLQISYSFSKIVSTANPNAGVANAGDQFFSSPSFDYDQPTRYMGRNGLDHTHEVSFGGSATLKYGPQVSLVGHFFSAAPMNLTLDPNGTTGGASAAIFQSDVTGDGTVGDIVPGTDPGEYMHRFNGKNLHTLIDQYNTTQAGQFTPAGQALISAGLFTPQQLTALQATQQPIAQVPQASAIQNAWYRVMDVNFAYPIRLNKVREGLALLPGVSLYNIGNFGNFTPRVNGGLLNTTSAGGAVAGPSASGSLNGPNGIAELESQRVQRGAGTTDIGGPRTIEFQLKLNF